LRLKVLQQTLDIVELDLWAQGICVPSPQFLKNAPGTLNIDLTGHLHRGIVAEVMSVPWTTERIGVGIGTLARAAWPSLPEALPRALLLHRLRQVLGAFA
jgi:hypothetical protein